jgi:RHS repeat-associated protein
VSITSPANNAVFPAPATITLAASASDPDGTIAKVDFYRDGTLITTVTAAPYGITWTGVPQGSYSLTVVVTDDLGAATTSATVPVTVGPHVAQMYFIHPDHLNTPRSITDQNGNEVWRWDNTEAFGSNPPNEDPGNTGNIFTCNLRAAGQYFDKETGLSYNYFRDFDPNLGRYIQSDPIGILGALRNPIRARDPQDFGRVADRMLRFFNNPAAFFMNQSQAVAEGGINLYGYAEQNPLIFIDPFGLAP